MSTDAPAQGRSPVHAPLVGRTSGWEMPLRGATANLARRMDMAERRTDVAPQVQGIEAPEQGSVHRALLSKALQRSVGNARVGRIAEISSQRACAKCAEESNGDHIVQRTPLQRNGDGEERSRQDRSRQSRPRDAPQGTRPIDETDMGREDIHKIKDGIPAGPKDWVGITPEGEVITTDEEGNAENHGPASNFLKEAHSEIPGWVWPLLGVVAMILIIACFATGICEFAAVAGALGFAAALLIIGLLKRAGIKDSGSGPTAEAESQPESPDGVG